MGPRVSSLYHCADACPKKKREKYIYIVPWRWFLLRFCSCRTFQDGWLWQYALHLLRGSDHIALTFTAVLLRLLQKEKLLGSRSCRGKRHSAIP